jgi:hypothetical protein
MGNFLIVALMGVYPFSVQFPMPHRIAPPAAAADEDHLRASEASEHNLRPLPPGFAPPALVAPRPRIVLKPGQKCAIPLTNVLRRNWGHDRMAFHPPRPETPSRDIIPPPGPSCDDVK